MWKRVKVLVGAFNQEKALVGAFSVILKTGCGTDGALLQITQSPVHWLVPAGVQLHRPAEAAEDADSVVRAGWAACHLARSAAAQAFSCHGRAASAQVTLTAHN